MKDIWQAIIDLKTARKNLKEHNTEKFNMKETFGLIRKYIHHESKAQLDTHADRRKHLKELLKVQN